VFSEVDNNFNHPSIYFLYPLNPVGLEPIPAVNGREAGYTLDRSPIDINSTFQLIGTFHEG